MIQVERVDSSAVPGACANCGQPLTGRFCMRCGEQVLDPHALTVVYLVFGIRRFYFGESPRPTRSGFVATAAALLVYLLNSAFITGVQLIGGMLALLSV